jgi:hypothetical protein
MQTSESRRGRKTSRAGKSAVAALLGAAATFVVLMGVATVADSPRNLSDAAQLPASTETFEVSPAGVPDLAARALAFSHANGQYEDSGLQVSYDVEVSV